MPSQTTYENKDLCKSALPKWLQDDSNIIKADHYIFNRFNIGSSIKNRRQALGVSLRGLAKWIGVSHTHLSRLEKGQKAINEKRINDITDILDLFQKGLKK